MTNWKCACWGCLLLLLPAFTVAQADAFRTLTGASQVAELVEMPVYPTVHPTRQTLLKMAFASPVIENPGAWQTEGQQVRQVDIVLTRYPRALESWEIGYDSLMHRRVRALFRVAPDLRGQEGLRWRIVLQTAGRDLASAREMLHGIVLHHQPILRDTLPRAGVRKPTDPAMTATEFMQTLVATGDVVTTDSVRPMRFDPYQLEENLELVRRIFRGEEGYHDSTALHVLDRHPEWEDMLVVVDWTASMYQHGALLARWQQTHRKAIQNFVFFNDGDGKYDDEKVPGATGGIYGTNGSDSAQVADAMEAVTLGGEGGDHRENDLEAVQYALNHYINYKSLVLVADNDGPVRNLRELLDIHQPIRIILSGVYKENIEPDYLTIAHYTGGSIHTEDFDLEDIAGQLEHGILILGENKYELQGKKFVRKRTDW